MDILIDFDGTCVTHDFPNVGKDIGAKRVLKKLVDNGHRLILFTMRSDVENPTSEDTNILCKGGNYLTDAVNWFKENDIPLYGINTNPTQKSWTHSPKAYGQLIIDDIGLGIPLVYDKDISDRPFVDWIKIEYMLIDMGIIKFIEFS
ncbi:gp95 [Sphingomonas phage PAU]|uniref:phosphoheptose isomerase n=1 Tax=Sphingomonas phage PAU TaxID=1150991 RepID=UPI00025731E9|nr:phosphoheptose isomerase [Sphingomonas phage PAU]AFF28093.1 gp95 [Sphingomonas phage PAU]